MNSILQDDRRLPDSPSRWFMRASAIGILVVAALNAVSFFVRSDQWAGLIGDVKGNKYLPYEEAIGFPFLMWEAGNTYGGMYVDYPKMMLNIGFAFALGAILGAIVVSKTAKLNQLMASLVPPGNERSHQPIQFSLRGLMTATALVALSVTIARNFAAKPETLLAIYALGPTALVAIAMIPQRLAWQTRVAIIIPATLCLIGAAIAIGMTLEMEFDRVLMGIFLCWVPQSAFAALTLTAWLLFQTWPRDPDISKEPNE